MGFRYFRNQVKTNRATLPSFADCGFDPIEPPNLLIDKGSEIDGLRYADRNCLSLCAGDFRWRLQPSPLMLLIK